MGVDQPPVPAVGATEVRVELRPLRRVPDPTVARLSVYLQCLRLLEREGVTTVSSAGMAERTGINAAQFRKDLSYFGEFGRPGVGYDVGQLKQRLLERMGLLEPHRVILVGAGSLGAALCAYPGFTEQGFHVVAVFDSNPLKIGQRLGSVEVRSIDELVDYNRTRGARIGIIAVPRESAQAVANLMVQAGIRCILNFAPRQIQVDLPVAVRRVDLTQELEALSYYLAVQEARER